MIFFPWCDLQLVRRCIFNGHHEGSALGHQPMLGPVGTAQARGVGSTLQSVDVRIEDVSDYLDGCKFFFYGWIYSLLRWMYTFT